MWMRRVTMLVISSLAVMTSPAAAQDRAVRRNDRREIQAAVIRAVLRQPHRDSLAASCISIVPAGSRTPVAPDSAFLAEVQVPGREVVPPGRCPPTYEIGERVGPNPPPRPPGARDPHLVTLMPVTLPRSGAARAQVWEDQGAHRTGYTCTAIRAVGGWIADCRVTYIAAF